MSQERPDFDPVDISSVQFWAQSAEQREEAFRTLRDERPVSWHRTFEGSLMPASQPGVWAVTRHADVAAVSKNPAVFSSADGVLIEEAPPELMEAGQSFIGMDAPRHTAVRRLISAAFTPRQIARVEDRIKAKAVEIVDDLVETDEGDFVDAVARQLPMWTIFEMIGLPEEMRPQAALLADEMVSWADPDVAAGREPAAVMAEAMVGILGMGFELTELKRSTPGDDIWTNLTNARIDGQQLTDEEIASFLVLLAVAGNDTTRNTASFGMKALCDFPDQRALLAGNYADLAKPAVEELIRFVTPVMTFRRTLTRDFVMNDVQMYEGDWLVTVFSSANRDERVFAEPSTLDVTRAPNAHLAFGGGGPHFCLGNMLARMQLKYLFGELLARAPRLEVGEPDLLMGNFVRGIKSMPYRLDAA